MDNRDYRNYDEERNKKFKGAFYVVISVVTLIVTIIGASFSYFIATASSQEGAVTTGSTGFSLDFKEDEQNLINTDLIPAAGNVVLFSAVRQQYNAELLQAYKDAPTAENKMNLANTKCRDDNGNSVCSTYRFTVTNPADMGVSQTLNFKLTPTVNEFANLYMMVVRANDVTVEEPATKQEAGVVIDEFHLSPNTMNAEDGWILDGMKYELASGDYVTYEIILYIKNLEDEVVEDTVISSGDQTEVDSNKSFAAAVVVYPDGGSDNQIYGVISGASDTFTD